MRSPVRSRKGFTLIEVMTVTAIIGVLSSIAIPTYQQMYAHSKRSEAMVILTGIAASELTFAASNDMYVATALNPGAGYSKAARDWNGELEGWTSLGFFPDGKVRCAYQVETFDSDTWFKATALCDVDGDGNNALIEYTSPRGADPGIFFDPFPQFS